MSAAVDVGGLEVKVFLYTQHMLRRPIAIKRLEAQRALPLFMVALAICQPRTLISIMNIVQNSLGKCKPT